MALSMASGGALADPMSGTALFEDVRRFESFGPHRYGSPGAERALDWIADELARAGLAVEAQRFTMARQYDLEAATLTAEGRSIEAVPHWWLPEQAASFALSAPIVPSGEAEGRFVRLTLPFDRTAYLSQAHRTALAAAFARRPAAVLLTIDHPSGEIYTYNVDQDGKPWPVPVILVAGRDRALLDQAEQSGRPISVTIKGRHLRDVAGRNVIGRIGAHGPRTIVVSTPVTSWFTSTCERAPGIAGFLALARTLPGRLSGVELVFVATAGHEIGHGGMGHFLRAGAPPPARTAAWAHLGASLACYDWRREGERWRAGDAIDTRARLILRSQSLDGLVRDRFKHIAGTELLGEKAAVGELREVHAAGYASFFGMAGLHGLFHTPADSAEGTGPAILEPVVRAYLETLVEIGAHP